MLANALLWCSSNDLSARLSRLKPAGASLSVPSVFAALLGVMAAPLKGDPELKPLGRSLYDKYLGEMEVINKGIGTLLEEHWDARGRGIEERESLPDTWENQLRTRQEDLEEREAKVARLEKKFRKAKNDEVDQPEEGDEGEGDYSEGLPTGDWRELCQHCGINYCTRKGPCWSHSDGFHNCWKCHKDWKQYGHKGGYWQQEEAAKGSKGRKGGKGKQPRR